MALYENSPNAQRHPIIHWICFRGSGAVTVFNSGNITSINDLGTGHYRINYSTSMPDTNYAISGNTLKGDTNNDGNQSVQFGGCTASSDIGTGSIEARCRVMSNNGANDPNVIMAMTTR